MDYLLNEQDYDLIELLQQRMDGLSFKEIAALDQRSATDVYGTLEKLRKWNHVCLLNKGYAHYIISPENKPMNIFRVACPACGQIRRLHDENQARTTCIRPACRTPKGKERTFEVLNRDWLKKGIKKPINRV